jgi:hypothetical protein
MKSQNKTEPTIPILDAPVTDAAPTFRCIYCGQHTPVSDRSLEHLWPQGLGGRYAPDFFMTRDVCRRCNNVAGLFVDAEFQRSFFMGVESIGSALSFLDGSRATPLPLVYMGFTPTPPCPEEICELWLGPRGEKIFYFHEMDREDFRTYAGGDPIKRRKHDPGRAYLSFARPNMFWISTVLQSVRTSFPRAALRLLTITDSTEILAMCANEDEQSSRDRAYLEPIWREKSAGTGMTLDLDHAKRFQAKLALGFGYALFGDAFSQIPYESVLRAILRERDPARRAEFPFVGSSLFAPPDPDSFLDRLSYPGAFTFLFNGSRQGVFLTIYSPGGRRIDTQIAPEPVTLPTKLMEQYLGSFVVLIVPAHMASFGPFPIGHYALHRFGTQSIPELAHLDALRVPLQELEKRIAHLEIPQPKAAADRQD